MSMLGTQRDYIMTTPMFKFRNYTEDDLLGIKQDLESLSTDNAHLNSIQFLTARNRYLEVISYVENCIIQDLKRQIAEAKKALDNNRESFD